MLNDNDPISSREKGSVPASFGTALAIDGLFGVGAYADLGGKDHTVDEIWFNIKTLARNTLDAVNSDAKDNISIEDLWRGVYEDMQVIEAIVNELSESRVGVKYYYSNYDNLHRKFPNAKIKIPKTAKQLIEHGYLEGIVTEYAKQSGTLFNIGSMAKFIPKRVALVTHIPLDLLNKKYFSKLYLLESHTGRLKGPGSWYTKLTNGKKLLHIPFNRLTLQVFGDNGTNLYTMSPAIKKVVKEQAEADNWTSVTTMEKVRHSINKMTDQKAKKYLIDLL